MKNQIKRISSFLEKEQACVVKLLNNLWCRGVVLDKVNMEDSEEKMFDIFLIDYGFEMSINENMVYHLHKKFSTQNCFAIQCKLSEVIMI